MTTNITNNTLEPPIEDTSKEDKPLNKGQYIVLYLKRGQKDKRWVPSVSNTQRFQYEWQ